jgi:3-oxoacyl-[acyl-carrier protein] reductase
MEARMSPQRLAVVTGASSGIGHATAQRLLEQGWAVIGISRRPCALSGVSSIEADLGAADLSAVLASELPQRITALCGKNTGQIALVHNAGKFGHDSALTIERSELQASLQVNVVASTVINKLVFPLMAPGSSIIYVGSTLSEKAVANTASYIISKHAVVGLMRATCQDLCGQPIHTVCVCPGFVDTPMLRGNQTDADMQKFAGFSTYKKLLLPHELAAVICNAAQTPALNGAVVHANYGQIEH